VRHAAKDSSASAVERRERGLIVGTVVAATLLEEASVGVYMGDVAATLLEEVDDPAVKFPGVEAPDVDCFGLGEGAAPP